MTAYSQFFSEASSIPNFAEALTRMLNPYEDVSLRVPFYITNSLRTKNKEKGVSMLMNPTNVSFRQAKRITRRDTQAGANFMHWTNQKGQNDDIIQMNFSGMTGNINLNKGAYKKGSFGDTAAAYLNKGTDWLNDKMAEGSQALNSALSLQPKGTTKNTAGVSKLASFWKLYTITRDPVIDVTDGSPVFTYISYSSPLFGNTFVTFIGHFDNALEFEDVAEEPFNKRWSFGFTAIGSMPDMDSIYAVMLKNLGQAFLNDLG